MCTAERLSPSERPTNPPNRFVPSGERFEAPAVVWKEVVVVFRNIRPKTSLPRRDRTVDGPISTNALASLLVQPRSER
jgi:hypothetical protein